MFNYNFIAFYLTFNYLDFVIEYHVKVIIARRHVQYIKYLRVHYYHWVDIYVCITITVLIFMCISGADPGFQVRGGAFKKIAPSGGRREHFWGISCEKS